MSRRTWSLILTTLMLGAGGAARAGEPEASPDLWKDAEFQKRFLGTYGVLGEVEPRVTAEERAELERIIPLMTSDLDKAAEQLVAVTTPASTAIFDFTLGNIYFQQGDLSKASDYFRAAVQKYPAFLRAHKNLGLTSVRSGRMEEAIQAFTRMIELGGGDGLTYGLLGHAYASREDFLSAESAYRQAALLQPDSLDWKLGMARCLFRQQKYAEAAALTGELIERHPDRVDLLQLQANAYVGLKEPMKAAQNYEILARMGKGTVDLLNALGDIYVNEAKPELAARAYIAAIELDQGQDPGRPLRAAEILAARGATALSGQVLQKVREAFGGRLGDDERRRMLKLEARLAAARGGGPEARSALEEIVALDPLDGEALILLGQYHAGAGDVERAGFYYERAEGLAAFEAEARLRHAQLLVKLSKYREAVPLLKRAQELKPREDVARYLEQVERFARTGS